MRSYNLEIKRDMWTRGNERDNAMNKDDTINEIWLQ